MNQDLTKVYNGFKLTAKEISLIEELRKVGFGKVEVFIERNQPVRIELVRESIMLK